MWWAVDRVGMVAGWDGWYVGVGWNILVFFYLNE